MISRLNGGSTGGSYVISLKKRLAGSPAVRRLCSMYCTSGSHEARLTSHGGWQHATCRHPDHFATRMDLRTKSARCYTTSFYLLL